MYTPAVLANKGSPPQLFRSSEAVHATRKDGTGSEALYIPKQRTLRGSKQFLPNRVPLSDRDPDSGFRLAGHEHSLRSKAFRKAFESEKRVQSL